MVILSDCQEVFLLVSQPMIFDISLSKISLYFLSAVLQLFISFQKREAKLQKHTDGRRTHW